MGVTIAPNLISQILKKNILLEIVTNDICSGGTVFPTGGMADVPPMAEDLLIPPPAKIPHSVDSPYQSCNFWSRTIFIFNFILFVHTGLTNFDFYCHSIYIYKMLCLASKKVRIVKITFPQIPTTGLEFPHPSMLFGKSKQNAICSKNMLPKTYLCPSI